MRVFCCLFIALLIYNPLHHTLNAKPLLSLKELKSKPKGIARDFYIWEFISDPSTSLQDSIQAYNLVYREIPKLKRALEKKGFHHKLPKNIICSRYSINELKKQDLECIFYGLKLSSIPSISTQNAQFFLNKLSNDKNPKSQNLAHKIKILRSANIAQAMLESDAQTFADIFNALPYSQKLKIFTNEINPAHLKRLAQENKSAFNKVLQSVILDSRFENFKRALLGANITNSDPKTFFLLGINEILHQRKQGALKYFEHSREMAIDPFFKNRAIFWQYLVSKNKLFLHDLQASIYVDIFSIFANQKLKTTPNFQIITDFANISNKQAKFDINDPFIWQILRTNMAKIKNSPKYESILKEFEYKDSIPHLAYLSNSLTKYQASYFIMPYADLIKWDNTNEKALTLAIAKQESNFLPALVSHSYALGMMQIMPFNVEPFAKKLKMQNITLESMFDPIIAYEFGRMFLDELDAEFKHPLFVAYAYNGGPGFLRRILRTKRLFLKTRQYEPWLSLELVPNEESRLYGMKVIANYVIYQQILGNQINLEDLLKRTLRY